MQSDSSPFAIQKRTNLRISENTALFRLGLVALLALHLGTDRLGAQQPTAMLDVSVGQPTAFVSPTLYGLMTEEITYSYDDDLYAEMVRNRTLQDHGYGGVAIRVRDEIEDRLSKNLLAGVSQHDAGRLINVDVVAIKAGNQYAVGGLLDQPADLVMSVLELSNRQVSLSECFLGPMCRCS